MHSQAIESIRNRVSGLIKQTQIIEKWPVDESYHQHIKALSKSLLKEKGTWLSDIDIHFIYLRYVTQAISQLEKTPDSGMIALTSLLSEKEQENVITGLTDFLLSVPRKYRANLTLPSLPITGGMTEVYQGLSVVFPSPENDTRNKAGPRGLLDIVPVNSNTSPKLELEVVGYAGFGPETSAARGAITAYKIAMQQLLNGRLLRRRSGIITNALAGWSNRNSFQVPKHHVRFVDLTSKSLSSPDVELSIDICQFIDSHEFSFSSTDQSAMKVELSKHLKLIARVLNSQSMGSDRLRAACQWRFDAYLSANPAISLVQTSIGFECLFGENEDGAAPLTKMLADRCAYLISRNIEGRKIIREKFTKFYKARSKVVHGNNITLSDEDLHLLRWGQSMLDLAIQEELMHVLPQKA
jgi:hypothetical protein